MPKASGHPARLPADGLPRRGERGWIDPIDSRGQAPPLGRAPLDRPVFDFSATSRCRCRTRPRSRSRVSTRAATVGLTPARRATARAERRPNGQRASAASTSASLRARPSTRGVIPQRARSVSSALWSKSRPPLAPRPAGAITPAVTARWRRGTDVPSRSASWRVVIRLSIALSYHFFSGMVRGVLTRRAAARCPPMPHRPYDSAPAPA
jgi:hypothetical protein